MRPEMRYSTATMAIVTSVPTTELASGPSTAKPTANDAWSPKMNRPFAVISCDRGTSSGIMADSAGAKNVVSVATDAVTT